MLFCKEDEIFLRFLFSAAVDGDTMVVLFKGSPTLPVAKSETIMGPPNVVSGL